MENKRPEFAIADQSLISLVSEIHAYFRDLQSYYQISRGRLLSELEEVHNPGLASELHQSLEVVSQKLTLFHILNNSISTVDTVLHTDTMISEFKDQDNL